MDHCGQPCFGQGEESGPCNADGDAADLGGACLTRSCTHLVLGMQKELARKAVEEGSVGVLACGGDGTLHEVINGVMGHPLASEVIVGIIAAGRCNDFAAAMDLPKTAEGVADLILTGKSRQIDLGIVGHRYFATVATLGFDSAVSQYVADGHVPRILSGTPSYVYAIFAQLLRYKDAKVHLVGEGFDYSGRIFLTATANTPQYGGNMKIAPGAEPEDGMLDVCLVKSVSRREVVMMLPRVFNGGHLKNPAVSMHRVKSLQDRDRGADAHLGRRRACG